MLYTCHINFPPIIQHPFARSPLPITTCIKRNELCWISMTFKTLSVKFCSKARNMIMVVSMMEILGEYTAVLTRVSERLLPRRSRRFGGFQNLLSSTTSSAESASFLVYFWWLNVTIWIDFSVLLYICRKLVFMWEWVIIDIVQKRLSSNCSCI